jgi:putative effector of murein hydrolase
MGQLGTEWNKNFGALQVNETAGAFSGLAMGLNALATALLLPIIWGILSRLFGI